MAQFFNPEDEIRVKRQRALAAQLMASGQQPAQTEVVGGMAIPQSPLAGFAKALSQGLGGYTEGLADKKENEIATRRQDMLAEAVKTLGYDPQKTAALLIQDPTTMSAGFTLANQDATNKRYEKLIQLKNENGTSGGATGSLVKMLMDDNPGMTFSEALYQVQTGFRQGTSLEDGKIVPTAGALDTKRMGKSAESQGTQQGKNLAENQESLPTVISNAQNTLQNISELRAHPGFTDSVGVRSPTAYLWAGNPVPGTDAAAFKSRLDQLKGGQFLEAYNTLRGGGQITEVEGAKAQAAVARMDTAQSEKEFTDALDEYESIIRKGVERAQGKAGMPVTPMTPQNVNAPNTGIKFLGFE